MKRRNELPAGWRQPPETTAEPVPLRRPYVPPGDVFPSADLVPPRAVATAVPLAAAAGRPGGGARRRRVPAVPAAVPQAAAGHAAVAADARDHRR